LDYFDLSALEVERKVKGELYLQFISEKSLSVGLYELKAGEQDPQTPHGEDEVYYVVRGRATMRVGTEKQDVQPGSIIYVRAGFEHKFNDIKENLELLVFFAPAHRPS
jgi:mannose-6-phosphate isomerase-like protein (cupin superfamily)